MIVAFATAGAIAGLAYLLRMLTVGGGLAATFVGGAVMLAGRGWIDRRFVLTRSSRPPNVDRTYDLEILVVDERGQTRVAGRVTQVYASTVRLHASRRVLYMTRADQGTENAYAFSIDTGALTPMTDNQLPGVTFSGFQPAGQGFIGVREERREDIWLIQQVTTPRTGNQAGR